MNQNSTFFDMPLSEGMKQTIKQVGFSIPTPIQEKAIPELLMGRDLLGQAQTGTGKTAAFAIPLIEMVEDQAPTIQALVVCPTRELCLQVCQELKRLSEHKPDLKTVALYGGQSIDQQFRTLKNDQPQIVVATPGRLFDHLRRKSVALSQVQMIVLDEADEMLDMGFRSEIEQIFDLLPEENQRIFFSATMPKAIKDLACTYLREPNIVKTESKTLTVSTIDQSYLKIRGKEKTELLCRLIEHRNPKLAVIFCNAKSTADEIVDDLIGRGFEAGVLHGDLSQNQRDRVMAKFKTGSVRFLVATDVAARGLDIDDVELVVNYHLPHDPEDYVHRIGRTGRAGRKGSAISLVEPRDNSRLRRISQFARIEIREEQPPSLTDIRHSKIESFFTQVKKAMSSDKIREYRSVIAKQSLATEDIAAAMLQLAMKRIDEKPQSDIVFAELSNRKYSGTPGGGERRFNDRGGNRNRRPVHGNSDRRVSNRDAGEFPRRRFDREKQAPRSANDFASRERDRPKMYARGEERAKPAQISRTSNPSERAHTRGSGDEGLRKKKYQGKNFGVNEREEKSGMRRARESQQSFDPRKGERKKIRHARKDK